MIKKYDKHLTFDLPQGYEVTTGTNEDGSKSYDILCGVKRTGGEKTSEVRVTVRHLDGHMAEENANLKADFPAVISGRINEFEIGLQLNSGSRSSSKHTLTTQLLFFLVGFTNENDSYALVALKTGKEADFSANAKEIAKHVNSILKGLTLDKKPGNFQKLTAQDVMTALKEGGSDEAPSPELTAGKSQKHITIKAQAPKRIDIPDNFEVSDDIESLKNYIAHFTEYWNSELEYSNYEILNERDKPITRSNDSRIRKMTANSEAVIQKYAEKLQEIMEKLNELGERKRAAKVHDSEIVEIADLIIDCFEKLHMKAEVEIYGDADVFKSTIDRQYSTLSSKWKRIRKSQPSVKIERTREELEDHQNELREVKKKISSIKRKCTMLRPQVESLETAYHEAQKSADDAKMVLDARTPAYEAALLELNQKIVPVESDINDISKRIADLEEQLTVAAQEHEYACEMNTQDKDSSEKALDELLKKRIPLESAEKQKKEKANSAILFKKKKQEEYEAAAAKLKEVDIEIEECQVKINRVAETIAAEEHSYAEKRQSMEQERDVCLNKKNEYIPVLDQLNAEKDDLSATQESFEEKAEEAENTALSAKVEYNNKKKELDGLEKDLAQEQAGADKLLKEIEKAETFIKEYEAESAPKPEKMQETVPPVENTADSDSNIETDTPSSNRPNFFCSLDTLEYLRTMEISSPEQNMELTVDVIELPYVLTYSEDKENYVLRAMQRGELYDHSNTGIEKGSLTLNKKTKDGMGTATEELKDVMGSFLSACIHLAAFVQSKNLRPIYEDFDPELQGILLYVDNAELKYKTVEGKARPDLMVELLFGGRAMGRPYMEDFWERSEREMMPLDEKIKAAEDGDIACMEDLVQLYLNGNEEITPDPKKTVYWLQKMADAGNATGMFNLSLHYAKGHGVKRDFKKAAEWMERSAKAGDEDAPDAASRYREYADSLEKAKSGDVQAMANLAGAYMEMGGSLNQAGPGDDYKESVKWAKKAADQNNGDGIWILALAYEHGRGVKQDIDKAVELYKHGAELGNAKCQTSYGAYLIRGDHGEKSPKKGFALCLAAAEQGYPLAMKNVGLCYQFANGTTGNMKTAIEWFEKYLQYEDDPELAQKVALFKGLSTQDPGFTDDYASMDNYDDDDPMPDYEFHLTYTKKGPRKERSNRVKIGDKIKFEINGDRIDAVVPKLGDIGDVSGDSWLKELVEKKISYKAEVIEVISYDKLINKRQNPKIVVRLTIGSKCGEMRKKMGWKFIPEGVYSIGADYLTEWF